MQVELFLTYAFGFVLVKGRKDIGPVSAKAVKNLFWTVVIFDIMDFLSIIGIFRYWINFILKFYGMYFIQTYIRLNEFYCKSLLS